MKNIYFLSLLTVLFTGCSNSLYYWGDSLADSYEYATGDYTVQEYLEKLLVIEKNFNQENKVPPNFYSEIGTLYLKQGDHQKAKEYFIKEKEAYPESTVLMDKLVANL